MRILDGEQVMARIFIGESDQWHHRPLFTALVERLRREGFAGATVFRGIEGFGAHSVIHTARLVDVSGDLPVILEVVDGKGAGRALRPRRRRAAELRREALAIAIATAQISPEQARPEFPEPAGPGFLPQSRMVACTVRSRRAGKIVL